jgi:serine/threonine kinase 16
VKKLAEGGFSEVFFVRGPNNEQWALKKCRAQTSEQVEQLGREVKAHHLLLAEPHILRLIASDVIQEQRGRSVVRFLFPLCEGGSWYELSYGKQVEEKEALRITLGACKGLRAMHKAGLLHRDVKPHNVLLAKNVPLLMDLGSCSSLPLRVPDKGAAILLQEEAAEQCSAPYRSPELYEPMAGKNIGGESDVWSMGCCLFASTYGKGWPPFEDPHQGVLKLAILNDANIKFPPGTMYSESVKTLVMKMVARKPENRMPLEDVIRVLEKLVGG